MLDRNDKCPCQSGKKYKKCCLKILPIASKDYLNNNFELIKFYSNLYRENIDVDRVIRQLESSVFSSISLRDLFRFRVFIDSVILLFNREKLERNYFRNKVVYNKFFQHLNQDVRMQEYLSLYADVLSKRFSFPHFKIDSFYINYNSSKTRPYDQLARVRNAFAHMNYGHFEFLQSSKYGKDYLIGYSIYNMDDKTHKSKNHGFILEPVLHRFIQSYFSNYTSYGIVYKHTFFTILDEGIQEEFRIVDSSKKIKFHSVTYKENEIYEGNDSHEMIAFTEKFRNMSSDELVNYIKSRDSHYDYSVTQIDEEEYHKLLKFVKAELNRDFSYKEFFYSIKFLYDFETEFSNFLVHMMQLNDRIIDFISPFTSRESDNINQIISNILELKEDESNWISFKYMFPILDVFNMCLRLEDDDLPSIEANKVDVSGFVFDEGKLIDYSPEKVGIIKGNPVIKNYYILERLRNAIAHGHIGLELTDGGSIQYHFSDIWNKRTETITIDYDSLIAFINQIIFRERN